MFDLGTFIDAHPIERRCFPRRSTQHEARLVARFETDVVDCRITDLSEEGARVAVVGRDGYPARLVLAVPALRTAYDATPIWAERHELGLRLVRSHDLTRDPPSYIAHLFDRLIDGTRRPMPSAPARTGSP